MSATQTLVKKRTRTATVVHRASVTTSRTKMNVAKINNRAANELDAFITARLDRYENENPLYDAPQSLVDWYEHWDFGAYNANIYNHGLHQYPARFIPQLARKILRVFADKESRVLDIFSGSGTTLLECKYLGIQEAFGIELNPFANFMASVKLQNIGEQKITRELDGIQKKYFDDGYNYKIINFKNIDFWYAKETKNKLSKLLSVLREIKNREVRNFYLLIFCEITRKDSYLEHGGFKMYRSKRKTLDNFNPDVWDEFYATYRRNIALLAEHNTASKNSPTTCHVLQGDSRKIFLEIEKGSVDLILTSPPYGDSRTTVAYGQYSRLPWQWLSASDEIISLDSQLLGGDVKNADTKLLALSQTLRRQAHEIQNVDASGRISDVLAFYNDLFETLKAADYYLASGKYFVLVTGNRTVKKIHLRTDLIISELAAALGFSTEKILSRNILNKRMARKNSPTNEAGKAENTMLTENIIILKKR